MTVQEIPQSLRSFGMTRALADEDVSRLRL